MHFRFLTFRGKLTQPSGKVPSRINGETSKKRIIRSKIRANYQYLQDLMIERHDYGRWGVEDY